MAVVNIGTNTGMVVANLAVDSIHVGPEFVHRASEGVAADRIVDRIVERCVDMTLAGDIGDFITVKEKRVLSKVSNHKEMLKAERDRVRGLQGQKKDLIRRIETGRKRVRKMIRQGRADKKEEKAILKLASSRLFQAENHACPDSDHDTDYELEEVD